MGEPTHDVAAGWALVSLSITATGDDHRPVYEFTVTDTPMTLDGAREAAAELSTLVRCAEHIEGQWAAAHPTEGGGS
jgi:hypothetical protein